MGKQITHEEAWEDFFIWAKSQPFWDKMSRKEKQYIYKTRKAARDGDLRHVRIERLLKKYAPDRYEFKSIVILHE